MCDVQYSDKLRGGGVYRKIKYDTELVNGLNTEAKPRLFNLLTNEVSFHFPMNTDFHLDYHYYTLS